LGEKIPGKRKGRRDILWEMEKARDESRKRNEKEIVGAEKRERNQ